MAGFGLLLFGGLGSLGVAVSTVLFRRLLARPSKSRYIKHSDEEDVPFIDSQALLEAPEVTTSLLKMMSAENRSDFTNDSDVCAMRYGEDFYSPGRAGIKADSSPSRNFTVSGVSGATTETGPLGAEEYVADTTENETISEDDFSKEDNAFQADEYSLESPQHSPDKATGLAAKDGILNSTSSPKGQAGTSEGEPATISEEMSSPVSWVQQKKASNVIADKTHDNTTQGSKDKPVAKEPATEVHSYDEDAESASSVSNSVTQSEIEVQFPTAPPATAHLAADSTSLVASSPSSPSSALTTDEVGQAAPVVLNPRPIMTKTLPADIFAAPLNATQVVDDPVFNSGVPTIAIDVICALNDSDMMTLPAGASTTTLAEAAGAMDPLPVMTVPSPVATDGSSTRAFVFSERKEKLKENAGPLTTGPGIKKVRDGMFGSRRSSRAEDARGINRFRLSDRIRIRSLRAVRSNRK